MPPVGRLWMVIDTVFISRAGIIADHDLATMNWAS